MASTCYSSIRGLAMRVTRLDGCGIPVTGGTQDYAVSCGFTTVGLSAQVDEGDDIVVRNAGNEILVNEPGVPQITSFDLTIDFIQVDPELFELFGAGRVLTDYAGNSVGFTVTQGVSDNGFALEVWSGLSGGDACGVAGVERWAYWLVPWIKNPIIAGDVTIENGPVTFQVRGTSAVGGGWGRGPYNVVATNSGLTPGKLPVAQPVAADEHIYHRLVEIAPPTCVCGYQNIT